MLPAVANDEGRGIADGMGMEITGRNQIGSTSAISWGKLPGWIHHCMS